MARYAAPIIAAIFSAVSANADEPTVLSERFAAGYQYRVLSRVHLTGELTLPPDKANPKARTLAVKGESAIEYDERILDAVPQTTKTLRIYKRMDFQRKFGDQEQDFTLRPAVRRMVILRHQFTEAPFSPDGPMQYAEIDAVRTDVFTPALAGLLPAQAVRPGDAWKAAAEAVTELTDLEKIDEGSFGCRFEEIVTIAGRKHARVSLTGWVRGVNEDGPSRNEVDGFFYFDLVSNHLSYLTFKGKHLLLDKDGKTNGWNEGTFTLTRQANTRSPDLSDSIVRTLATEPNADNTLLLYDNPDFGIKFLHSRRWRIGKAEGRQLLIDDAESRGNGILLTLEDAKSTPAPEQFLRETEAFLKEQKGRIFGTQSPRELRPGPNAVSQFAIEAELSGQKLLLDYYVLRQPDAGATIAARVVPADLPALRPDIERMVKTMVLSRPAVINKK